MLLEVAQELLPGRMSITSGLSSLKRKEEVSPLNFAKFDIMVEISTNPLLQIWASFLSM